MRETSACNALPPRSVGERQGGGLSSLSPLHGPPPALDPAFRSDTLFPIRAKAPAKAPVTNSGGDPMTVTGRRLGRWLASGAAVAALLAAIPAVAQTTLKVAPHADLKVVDPIT